MHRLSHARPQIPPIRAPADFTCGTKQDRVQAPVSRLAFASTIENLANGDDVVFAFKWLCNDLEQLAFDGFPVTPELYTQIESVGQSVNAPPGQWQILSQYVK